MKYAICNELFENWDFSDVCRKVAELGYEGLEVAPFTLAPMVTDINKEMRRTLRKQAEDAGVQIIGLHWLLAKLEGFHFNSPDPALRKKTADYLREQTKLCGELGGKVMVFGSPGARQILPGTSRDEAFAYAADTLRQFAPTLADYGVKFCLEPLTTMETNFMNTADEAAELMQMVDHPNVVVHLDVKAMSAETKPIPQIIREHHPHTGHFHANDANLRGPGMGDVDFVPIFNALCDTNYKGWVSVEVFDFKPDPETIARESIEYMRRTCRC